MKKLRAAVAMLMLGVLLTLGMQETYVYADTPSLCYENITTAKIVLNINDNTAYCMFYINGDDDVSNITGTIKLYDETSKTTVSTWTVLHNGRYYSSNTSAAVKSGHTYTLSFSGMVYNASGKGESISILTSKKN